MPRPATFPDVHVFAHDFNEEDGPLWPLFLIDKDKLPIDASTFNLAAPVYDGGVLMGELIINRDNDNDGELVFELTRDVFDKLGQYSRWYLREHSLLNQTLMEGKIVKPIR